MQNMYNNITGSEYLSGGIDVFGKVTGYFSSQEERKSAQIQADALIAQGKSQVEVAKIMQQTKLLELEALKSGAGKNTKAGSTALYIGLGVGAVVILGVVIFAVTRKKE
jgi:CHASE3 domain sensor protein